MTQSQRSTTHSSGFAAAFFASMIAAGAAAPVYAQVPSAHFACEPMAGQLRVDVMPEVDDGSEPRGADVATFTRMVRTKPFPVAGQDLGYDGTVLPVRDFARHCWLAGARYVLRLRAHPFGTHILGRCGAALPSFDVTLLRDGHPLLDSLLLQDNCGETETPSYVGITRVVADEHARTMTLSLLGSDLDRKAGWPPHAELVIPFDELPRSTQDRSQRELILARVPHVPASASVDEKH